MPRVYISTDMCKDDSVSEGATKQYYLDLILSEIVNCLNANAISYDNEKSDTNDLVWIVLQIDSSKNNEDPSGLKILYQSGNPESKRLSSIILDHVNQVYEDKVSMDVQPQETINESVRPLVRIIFMDSQNSKNIEWIKQNIEEFSKQIIMSLDEYLGLPYIPCEKTTAGVAKQDESIRGKPNLNSEVVGCTTSGKKIDVLGQWEDWYVVGTNNNLGYIQTKFIEL